MSDKTIEEQRVWEVTETPDLDRIQKEFERAGGQAHCSLQKERNDRIRFNRWKGRTSDYKKHRKAIGRDPVPYEDAWDSRPGTADDIMEDLVDVVGTAFRSAQFHVRPCAQGQGPDALETALQKADAVKRVITKYVDRIRSKLNEEADYLLELGLGYGEAVVQTGWDRRLGMRERKVTMDQLKQGAMAALVMLREISRAEDSRSSSLQGDGNPPPHVGGYEGGGATLTEEERGKIEELARLPDLILNPDTEGAAAGLVQTFARDLAGQLFQSFRGDYGDEFLTNYKLSAQRARRIVRELREEEASTVPAPYVKRDQPYAVAREVGYDFFLPPETTELDLRESTPWCAVRDWLTAAQIRESEATDGWDADWCAAAIGTAGKVSQWVDVLESEQGWAEDDESDVTEHNALDTQSGLIEVVWFYAQYVTPEGIPQVWCTIYCPHALTNTAGGELWGKHYNADEDCCFYEFRPRKKRRSFFDNQGLPEQVGESQQRSKNMWDMLVDRANLEVNPPIKVRNRLSMRYKMGPGSQVPEKREGEVGYMEPPTGSPQLAFQVIEFTDRRLANKYGLMREGVLPAQWQMKLGKLTERYLLCWQAVFSGMLQLILREGSDPEIAAIVGPEGPVAMADTYEVSLFFDVKNLDSEFVWKKVEAITKTLLPMDRAGVIDIAELCKIVAMAIDSTWATALVRDRTGASQATFKEVRGEVSQMYLGNEADYVENDPAAEMKLDFLKQIISGNPDYLEALGVPSQQPQQQQGAGEPAPMLDPQKFKPRFKELLEKYQQNLDQSVKQEKNKMVGRLGMQPGPGSPAMQ